MNRIRFLCFLPVLIWLLFSISCEKKFDLTQVGAGDTTSSTIGDTNYVEVFPPWGGFENPRAVLIGHDQLIYVADDVANEIVMMDAGGAVLGRRPILKPITIAQNAVLDLYVGGASVSRNGRDTVAALFKIFLVRFDTTLVDTLIDTLTGTKRFVKHDTSFFFDHPLETAPLHVVRTETDHPDRRFTGVGIFPGNGYIVARAGPDNSSFVDPDSRVLRFNKGDTLITPVPELHTGPTGGTGITDINQLTGLAVFSSSWDYIVTQSSEGIQYGAIWMIYQNTADFQGWTPKYDPANPSQQNKDFLRLNNFKHAAGVTIDPKRSDIFIVDSELDSIVKFDRNGNFKPESFGRYKSKSRLFPGLNHPSGIAFSNDCTLYVADTGNKVIRRFKLATQTQCF